jgi:hypothetical protein
MERNPKARFERTVTGNHGDTVKVADSQSFYYTLSFYEDVSWTSTVAMLTITWDSDQYSVSTLNPKQFSSAIWAFMLAYDVMDRLEKQEKTDQRAREMFNSAVSKAQEAATSLYDKCASILRQFTSKK